MPNGNNRSSRSGSRQKADAPEDQPPLDPILIAAIRQAVRDEVSVELKKISDNIDDLVAISKRVEEVETAMKATYDRLENTINVMLPAVNEHMMKIAEGLTSQSLALEVHRRKWNLILHGVEGPAGESEAATRKACLKFASEALKLKDCEKTQFAACHRLSRKKDAGIIIRFLDLAERDRWLSGTVHLKNYASKVSLSPDLPPVVRPMKDELMLIRSKLDAETKKKAKVKHTPRWPFVNLQIEGQRPRLPTKTLGDIVKETTGVNSSINFKDLDIFE